MRSISLNGYIDDEVWWGDEITPDILHEQLYGSDESMTDDVEIRLNSYGGSCQAAVHMFDDIRAYPGRVNMVISGTAASAATVLAQAADHLSITPGSLMMIHDPSCCACGNVQNLMDVINMLRACKDSILDVYLTRSKQSREVLAQMMQDTTWFDATQALENGLVDEIAIIDKTTAGILNAVTDKNQAQKMVNNWLERKKEKPATISQNSIVIRQNDISDIAISAEKISANIIPLRALPTVTTADTLIDRTSAPLQPDTKNAPEGAENGTDAKELMNRLMRCKYI